MRFASRRPHKTPPREHDSDTNDSPNIVNEQPSQPKTPPTGAKLRGIAFAMLGRREHSEQEFKQKLLDLGANPLEVTELIQEFQISQYQSDQRMAEMIVRANVRQGRGPARVKQTLRERRVAAELAQDDLADTDWLRLARTLRIKKFGSELPTDPKEKNRQFRFLQYRGFDMQTCRLSIGSNDPLED